MEIEELKPFVKVSNENGGSDRPINVIEIAEKINEIIDWINSKKDQLL